jgi:hypothetical protein
MLAQHQDVFYPPNLGLLREGKALMDGKECADSHLEAKVVFLVSSWPKSRNEF